MSGSLLLIVFIILVALIFDYINGFHDAANSIATVVSTRVLTPMQAVAWAAFFNFVAAFGFGVQVARTVGKGVVEASVVDQWVILGGLIGAIAWNLITWYFGIPSSSSHALIGGFAGAAVAKAGFGALLPSGLIKILVFIVLAPVLGLALGFSLMIVNRLTGMVLPASSKWLIDDVIGKQRADLLLPLALAALVATIIQATTGYGLAQVVSIAAQRAITEMRSNTSASSPEPVSVASSSSSKSLRSARARSSSLCRACSASRR